MTESPTARGSDEETEADASSSYATERKRGVLTPSDRAFLLGERTDYEDDSRIQKRRRIRKRVLNALLDFPIIFEGLPSQDRETLFDPDAEDRNAYVDGLTHMLGFVYLGLQSAPVSFDRLLREGVSRSEQKLADSGYRSVRVEFDVETVGEIDVEATLEKLSNAEYQEITAEERRVLVYLLAETESFSFSALQGDLESEVSALVEAFQGGMEQQPGWVEELSN